MIFEISIFKLAKISSKILDTKEKIFFCRAVLLDLKNAFGGVDHELNTYVLKFHLVPDRIIQLIQSLYTDYHISIATDEYLTPPITVEQGVLQGDSLSPLLFNLVINTLINTIKQEKLNCIGYIYDDCIPPKHWQTICR